MNVKLSGFFAICFLLELIITTQAFAAEATPPNVMIILADDLGYSDLGCYGSEIETPNLDRLADGGLRFTQFYNTARCWPTRAGILTGYYAQQVRRDELPNVKPSGGAGVRPGWAKLLPEMLRPAGFRSYHSGKWHVDGLPLSNGFDRSYRLDDHDRFFSPKFHFVDDKPLPPVESNAGYYSTTAIADHAIQCLKDHSKDHADKPFFQYVCFTSPHFPLQALPEDVAKYRDRYRDGWDVVRANRYARQRAMRLIDCDLAPRIEHTSPKWNLAEDDLQRRIGAGEIGRAIAWTDLTDEQRAFQSDKMAIHAAMIDRMDREIGRVLDQLTAIKARDNTLIFFLSDNGASAEQIIRGDGHDPAAPPGSAKTFLGLGPGWSTVSNAPFRMHKSWVHEGGISTPLIVNWPNGIIDNGALRHTASHLIDLVPTILEATRVKRPETWDNNPIPAPPGKSLTPAFAQDVGIPHDFLWWSHIGNRAVRIGDWKLVAWGNEGVWELYNLKIDRSETKDLAKSAPDKVRDLESAWQKTLAEFQELARRDLK